MHRHIVDHKEIAVVEIVSRRDLVKPILEITVE